MECVGVWSEGVCRVWSVRVCVWGGWSEGVWGWNEGCV